MSLWHVPPGVAVMTTHVRAWLVASLLLPAVLLGVSEGATNARAATPTASTPIAYDGSGNGPVDVISFDGSNAHQLGPASASLPNWKPDASAVAVVTGAGVVVTSADGSSTKELSAVGSNPTFSPDGTQLVSWIPQGSNKQLIVIANADGTSAHVVWDDTRGILSAELGYLPKWAPDSSAIVFNTSPAGCIPCLETGGLNQVWMVNADGSGLHHVAAADGIEHVAWSPDGSWLVGDGFDRVHPDGTDRQDGSAGANDLSWSPDGTRIAYLGGSTNHVAVSIADSDGLHSRDLIFADPATTSYSDLQWLPDGSDLVFHVQTHNTASNTDTSLIETVNVDGGGMRTVVSGQDPVVPSYIKRLAGATRVDTGVSVSERRSRRRPRLSSPGTISSPMRWRPDLLRRSCTARCCSRHRLV